MSAKALNDEILKNYERSLLSEKEKTLKTIRGIDENQKKGSKDSSGNLSSFSIHSADLGSDTNNSERQIYLLGQEQTKLKKLNSALRRIYDKSYGICQICGCYIPELRLKVIPYATLCIECKNKEDQKRKRK